MRYLLCSCVTLLKSEDETSESFYMRSGTSNLFVTPEFLHVNGKFINNALIRHVFSVYWPTSVKLVEMQCLYNVFTSR